MNMKQYAKENSFQAKMDATKGIDGWDNYGGPNLGKLVSVVSQNRDSEIMQVSNFVTALELLGGESDSVQIHRFGHWGCGWFETIFVNPKDKAKLKIAFKIYKDLKEYPVLDEDDYYERENEYHEEYAEGAKEDLAKALAKHFGVKHTKRLEDIAISLNVECQRYAGNDSCINVYHMREPDNHDVERLKTCLEAISYDYKTSKVFKQLQASVNAYSLKNLAAAIA